MKMPFGKFKGMPLADIPTQYLHWVVINDAIRFKRPPLIAAILDVLRERYRDNFDGLLAELRVDRPPPERWKTAEREAAKAAARAEKLAKLEARRQAEREKLRADTRNWLEARTPPPPPAPPKKPRPAPPRSALFRQPPFDGTRLVNLRAGWVVYLNPIPEEARGLV